MEFFIVFEVVAPVFCLSLLGYIWVKLGFEYQIKFVTRLSMTVAVPCLIFVSLMNANIQRDNLLLLSKATLFSYLAIIIFFSIFVWISKINWRTYMSPLTFGNTGNVGLPLALFAFGDLGLQYAVVVFAVMAILSFTIGIWFVSGGKVSLKVLFYEPLVVSTILGAIFLFNGWMTPVFLTSTLELIGQMAIPLMLITLGVTVATLKSNDLISAVGFSLLKSIVCFSCGFFIGKVFALDKISLSVLILQVSTPVAVTAYLLAHKYEADSDTVAGLVIVSTLLSIATLPILLMFLI